MNNLTVNVRSIKTVPAVIEYNKEEIEAVIVAIKERCKNEVVTIDNIQEAKKIMAGMNTTKKEIKAFEKEVLADVNPGILAFKAGIKTIVGDLTEGRQSYADQVEYFEDQERERKREVARLAIIQTQAEFELKTKYYDTIELKDAYVKMDANPTKVKKLIVKDFEEAKTKQEAEQMKIDVIDMIIGANNKVLRFKFCKEDFERYINDETSLKELNEIVSSKVNKRLEDEKAELVRIEAEKLAAVEKAKEDERKRAEAEAIRVKEEAERKAAEELARIEREKQAEVEAVQLAARLEQEARDTEARIKLQEEQERNAKVLEVVQESIIVPVETVVEEPIKDVTITLHTTVSKMNALKEFMELHNIEYTRG